MRCYYNGQQACSSVLRSIQAASSCLFQLAYALLRGVPSSRCWWWWSWTSPRVKRVKRVKRVWRVRKPRQYAMTPNTQNARRHLPQDGQYRRCVLLNRHLAVSHTLASARFIKYDEYWASSMAVVHETDIYFWTSTYIFWTSYTQARTHANDQ